jgi:uncharacterized glyoxalase superfamily protein PhnB
VTTEIYPMPMFPMLDVDDAAASARWYESLGFQTVFTWPDPSGRPLLVHLRWAKYADLMLRQQPGPVDGPRGGGVSLTFTMPTDEVESLAERARSAGARILSEPTVQPWNARDTSIADPDGYHLTFSFGPVDADLTFEEVTGQPA